MAITQSRIEPVRPNKNFERELKKSFSDFLLQNYWRPLARSLLIATNQSYNNSFDLIENSFTSGEIFFSDGIVKGKFSAPLLSEFRKLGYKFDKNIGGFRVPKIDNLPVNIQMAIGRSISNQNNSGRLLLSAIDNIDPALLLSDEDFLRGAVQIYEKIHFSSSKKMASNIEKKIPTINLSAQISGAKEYSDNYINSMKFPIKDFLEKETQELRQFVTAQISKGASLPEIREYFQNRYGVSERKAKFWAHQEVGLATNFAKKIQLNNAGINKYIWRSADDSRVRPYHEKLDGNIFFYDNPPIIELRTGKVGNPGETWGCRCLDEPIIEQFKF